MRTSTRSLLALAAVSTLVATATVTAPATAKSGGGPETGEGTVFMVNPVQSSGEQSLTDQNDSADAVPASEYAEVELRNLDGTGYLSGDWVNVKSSTGKSAYSAEGIYHYNRSQDQFEQVMGYFWVNQAQEYLQSLGFGRAGTGLPGIIDEPFDLKINQYGGDNSYQTSKPYRVRLGKGGVDDAEDAEVIVHEYGHAIHTDQVPGYGQSLDAGAIGEGFGDYFAVSVGLDAADQYDWPVRADEPCVADWDATSYHPGPVHCLRRMDQDLTLNGRGNQVHFDGMIWSRALWDIRADYVGSGRGTEAWDTTLIASQFDYAPDTSFQAAAKATYLTALARDDVDAAQDVRDRFVERGIEFETAS